MEKKNRMLKLLRINSQINIFYILLTNSLSQFYLQAEIRLASCFKPSTGAVNKHDSRAEQKQTPRDTCKRTKQGSSHFTFEFAV